MREGITSAPLCSRCGKVPAKVHMPDTPRCEACFAAYLERTFKVSVGRLGAGGRHTIAMALSGGECSASASILLGRYHSTLQAHPKLSPANIVLIHINLPSSSLSSSSSPNDAPQIIHDIANVIPGNPRLIVKQLDEQLYSDILAIQDASDRAYFLRSHVDKLLVQTCASVGADFLVVGSSAHRAAASVLSSIACSRGSQVSCDAAAVVDVDTSPVRVVKPLIGVPVRLLVRFARMQVPGVEFERGFGVSSGRPSLHAVVSEFIAQVNEDNPSSVHNVVKVAGRLMRNKGRLCDACGYVIASTRGDTNGNEERFSDDNDAKDACGRDINDESECGSCACNGSEDKISRTKTCRNLCLGCIESVNRADISTQKNNGSSIHSNGESKNGGDAGTGNPILTLMKRECMRKEIEDFLL